MSQLRLFDQGQKRQSLLQNISPDACTISPFNTRKTRPDEEIDKLAQRIAKNGFELTRALWAYRDDGKFSVFAGGTRLEAARRAQSDVAVVLYEGYGKEEISKLSDQDNDNDEYHQPVLITDIWAEYVRLQEEEGWTQDTIAEVKGVNQARVSERIKWQKNLPKSVVEFIQQDILAEGHLREITSLFIDEYFSSWLTSSQAWLELAELVVRGKTKDGKIRSVRSIGQEVGNWKKFIALAEKHYQAFAETMTLYEFGEDGPKSFTYRARDAFVKALVDREARSQTKVKEAKREVSLLIADNLKRYKIWIDERTATAARQAIRDREEKALLSKFVLGDCLGNAAMVENESARLLLVDPPYGQNYQSNRRWRTNTPSRLEGDKFDDALLLFSEMLRCYIPKLAENAHMLVFCNAKNEPEFRKLLDESPLSFSGSLIWVKEEHSAGDLECAFGPSHERILHYIKGRPKVEPRRRDVFEFARDFSHPHPTTKPLLLLEGLIRCCTNEGDLIIDPLAGIASTLLASMRLDRDFWGCEIDDQWYEYGCQRLLEELENGNRLVLSRLPEDQGL